MYKHILTVHDNFLAKEQSLPQNTTVECNGGSIACNGALGAIELVLIADTDCTLNANKELSVTVSHADTDKDAFVTLANTIKYTTTEQKTWKAGEQIAFLPLPSNTKAYIKAHVGTTDTDASGTFSLIPSYLAR